MSKLCERTLCTGCGACMNICPVMAILMEQDNSGFWFPVINPKKCIDCGICQKTCPVINSPEITDRIYPRAYAAINLNKEQLKNSSSGGMFRAFADSWDGAIYGAYLNSDYTVHIKKAEDENDLLSMQGSKYVFSRTDYIYNEIKSALDKGESILFFGLPCQVAALRKYLAYNYTNLLCIDIVCHGCPSEKLFQDFIKETEQELGKIKRISFTDKECKWVPTIEKNTRIVTETTNMFLDFTQNPYMYMFMKGWVYRDSCYQCKFANIKRMGDLTIGDFFGLGIFYKYNGQTENGVSQVLVNTKKGMQYFDGIENIQKETRVLEECMLGNPNLWKPSERPLQRSEIYQNYEKYGWCFVVDKYWKKSASNIITKTKYLIRKTLPRFATRLMIYPSKRHNQNKIVNILETLRDDLSQ